MKIVYIIATILVFCVIILTMNTWSELVKSQEESETIEEAIARIVAEHNDDNQAHSLAGQSIDEHRKNTVLDHPEGSVVSDKFQTGGLSLVYDFSNLSILTTYGTIENSSWPGVTLYADSGTPKRAYITNLGSNVRPYVNYAYDFLLQFSFFLGVEGTATAHISFGQISANALSHGISLDLAPNGDFINWVKAGGYRISDELSISRATWHTMRLRYSPVEHLLYVYLDAELIATLAEPTNTTESAGADWVVHLSDSGNGEANMQVEYILVARSN